MFDAKERPVCYSDPIPVKAVILHLAMAIFAIAIHSSKYGLLAVVPVDPMPNVMLNPSSSFSIAKEVDMLDLKSTQSD